MRLEDSFWKGGDAKTSLANRALWHSRKARAHNDLSLPPSSVFPRQYIDYCLLPALYVITTGGMNKHAMLISPSKDQQLHMRVPT